MAEQSIWRRLWALRAQRLGGWQQFALSLMALGGAFTLMFPGMVLVRQINVSALMEVPATVVAIAAAPVDPSGNAGLRTVSLTYEASGVRQNVVLAAGRFDESTLVAGGTVLLYVNPNKIDEVETGPTTRNLLMTTIFTAVAAAMAIVGWTLFRWLTPELYRGRNQPSSIR
jgi:hypothetical protein